METTDIAATGNSQGNQDFSERGFAYWEPVSTDYGADVKASESSAAEGPHLWLEIKQPPPEYGGQPEKARAVAHCTLPQAREIRDRLDAAIKFSEQRWNDPE